MPVVPIAADDTELRAYVEEADVVALLMALAHLTGDLQLLREEWRPSLVHLNPEPLDRAATAAVRQLAVERLGRYRDAGCPPPADATPQLVRAIVRWALGDGQDELVPLLMEELVLSDDDARTPTWSAQDLAPGREFRVAIVGAGMSGLLAAHRLSQAGVAFTIFEKDDGVGGTWAENTYPGCRVDVSNHLYSYSFGVNTDWPEYYCTQPVLLDYFERFAREAGLLEHIRFGTEVVRAAFDEARCEWQIEVRGPAGEEVVEAHALVSATGQLNRPNLPDISGGERFAGRAFHTARWDHSVDLTGARVGVIGTGASAFQVIPEIAERTGELVVFQRNPPWILPTPNYVDRVSEAKAWLFAHVPHYATWYRFRLFMPGLSGLLEATIVDPEYGPDEVAVSAANAAFRDQLLAWLEEQVADAPELRPHVVPSYPVGAKRALKDNGRWIQTLKRDDVRLLTEPIREIVADGIVTQDGRLHELDVIVYGTGFRASEFLMPMEVVGRGGVSLQNLWNGDARAHYGITVPGFPNLFCLYGPNTNLVVHGGGIIFFSECAVNFVLDAVRHMLQEGHDAVDVLPEVYEAYNARVDEGNAMRAWGWSGVSSWYKNARGRSAQNWPFSALEYWQRTHRLDPAEHEMLRRVRPRERV